MKIISNRIMKLTNFCYLQRAASDIWIRLNISNRFTVIFTTLDVMFLLFKLFRFWHWPLMTLVEITALISIVVLLVDYICVFKNDSTCFKWFAKNATNFFLDGSFFSRKSLTINHRMFFLQWHKMTSMVFIKYAEWFYFFKK